MKLFNISSAITSVTLSLAFQEEGDGYDLFFEKFCVWLKDCTHCSKLVIYHDNMNVNRDALDLIQVKIIKHALNLEVQVNPRLSSHGFESPVEYFLAMQRYFKPDEKFAWVVALDSPEVLRQWQPILNACDKQLQANSCQLYLLMVEQQTVGEHKFDANSSCHHDEHTEKDIASCYNDSVLKQLAITPTTTVLALSLDFDGCTDDTASRARLCRYIQSILMQYPYIQTIKLMIGSARQSVSVNFSNGLYHTLKGYGYFRSCDILGRQFVQDLTQYLTTHLESKVPEIIFEPILLQDVLNHLRPGTAFNALSQDFNCQWGSVVAALNKAIAINGLNSIVLSNDPPAWPLADNHWHLRYAAGQFTLYCVSNASMILPRGLASQLIQWLTTYNVWSRGQWGNPRQLLKKDYNFCLKEILRICIQAVAVEITATNLDNVQVPIFKLQGHNFHGAGCLSMSDELKTTLLFLQSQWLSLTSPEECLLLMLDDRAEDEIVHNRWRFGILKSLTDFYAKNPMLLPSNIRMQCVPFDARHAHDVNLPQPKAAIQGTGYGLSEMACRWVMRHIAMAASMSLNPWGSEDYKRALINAMSLIYSRAAPAPSQSQILSSMAYARLDSLSALPSNATMTSRCNEPS